MLFNSIEYILLFLPITFFMYYYLISKRLIFLSKGLLVFSSIFFYTWWNFDHLPLILMSLIVNFSIGSEISKAQEDERVRVKNKSLLIVGILFNVFALVYFKYFNFIVDNINLLMERPFEVDKIVLPLAISFFTFQQIAYLVDSYKGQTREYDFLTYALFVSFFPQLIAGPIIFHHEIIPQFKNVRNMVKNYKNIFCGIFLILVGLLKKVIIADYFAKFSTAGFDQVQQLNLFGGWMTSLSYTIQIYFDFSSYCDMAMGSSLLFNIYLPLNFDSPYKSLNIAEFWRRWHITLTRFLRNYIYIPLGGNRGIELKTYLNIFIIYFVSGVWHGAAWKFIVWGMMHGAANMFCRVWHKTGLRLNKFVAWFITFNFINVGWVVFRANSFTDVKKILFAMVDYKSVLSLQSFQVNSLLPGFNAQTYDYVCLILLVFGCVVLPNSVEIVNKISLKTSKFAICFGIIEAICLLLLVAKILIIPSSEFIYFQF